MRKVLCLTMNSSWTHWTPQNKHLKKSLSSSKLANKQKLRSTLLVRWACTVRETSVFGCVNGVSYANAGEKRKLKRGLHTRFFGATTSHHWGQGLESWYRTSDHTWKEFVSPLTKVECRPVIALTKGLRSKHYSLLSVSAVQPFYISICISRLTTQHTTFISLLVM